MVDIIDPALHYSKNQEETWLQRVNIGPINRLKGPVLSLTRPVLSLTRPGLSTEERRGVFITSALRWGNVGEEGLNEPPRRDEKRRYSVIKFTLHNTQCVTVTMTISDWTT